MSPRTSRRSALKPRVVHVGAPRRATWTAAPTSSPYAGDEHLGCLAPLFGLDVPASSIRTRQPLPWRATHPGLTRDLDDGHDVTHG